MNNGGIFQKKKRNTLKKFERIKKKKDFQKIRKEGKRLGSKNYILIYTRNNLPHNRLAIIISKKVGKAVTRNYEKRICREIYRKLKDSLPVGFDFLIIVKNAMSRKSKKDITRGTPSVYFESETELKRLFEKIN